MIQDRTAPMDIRPVGGLPILFVLLAALGTAAAGEAAPRIHWISDPVQPGETVVIMGDGLRPGSMVEMQRTADAGQAAGEWTGITPLQTGPHSIKAVIPADWKPGIVACRVRSDAACSNILSANLPAPWWWNGDAGANASPGGWVRVFGKCLDGGVPARARLRSAAGGTTELTAVETGAYALRFVLPDSLAVGDHQLSIHNGHGGDSTWQDAGILAVRAPMTWRTEVFNVRDFGPHADEALAAALAKARANGGGIVHLPRGRYQAKGTIVIPPHTLLRGEAMELVSIHWPDMDKPPAELLSGSDGGVESLTLYCQNHRDVIADTAASQHFQVRHVRIRANCYFMIEDAGKAFRGRQGPASHRDCGNAISLRGGDVEVTDCDIYASNVALRLRRTRTGLIARNRLLYGGRGYTLEGIDRLVFEDNLVCGDNLLSIGNDITTFYGNYARHVFYHANRIQQMYGADREMMTLDAGGGAYSGTIAAADGTRLTLSADPAFHDYAPKPHSDWTGAAVQILDGTGAGQYRIVTAHAGRDWTVDSPWTIPPDAGSRISIAPFRGRSLFIGNTFEDGGPFQLYGAGHDSIVAGNRCARMDGLMVWGLNPHGWGHQPSWGCQFLDNEILEGNGYGGRSATLATIASDESKTFDGPMVRAAIFRRNVLHNNARIALGGMTEDVLVEGCTVRHNDSGIGIRPTVRQVLLRGNRFEDVVQPLPKELPADTLVVP